jgi:hypothetical protein
VGRATGRLAAANGRCGPCRTGEGGPTALACPYRGSCPHCLPALTASCLNSGVLLVLYLGAIAFTQVQGPDQRPPKPRRPVSATSVELAVLLVHETFGGARVTAPEL